MKPNRRQFIASTLLTTGALIWPASAQDKNKPADDAKIIGLRGRVVCLTEELQPYQLAPDCAARGHVYSLKTAAGKLHPFLPTDMAAAVWLDARFRERELQVTARQFPRTEFIEAIRFQSWRAGKLYDLAYFCDVCSISTHKPGPCECCQDPVVFRETPAEENP